MALRSNRFTLQAAVAAGLALAVAGGALAQSPSERLKERRERAEQERESQPAERQLDFPEATRQEPEQRTTAKLQRRLESLFEAYEADDPGSARPLADAIIAEETAGAYEKSVAARIMGSMLIASDSKAAQTYLQQAVDMNGLSNNEHFNSMWVIAQLQMQDERFPEALATVERFLAASKSQEPEHLVLKANVLYRLERYPEAIAVLKPVVESGGDSRADWTQLLMGAYAESGQAAEAARLAEKVAASTPTDKRAQLNLAATYMQSEQYDKAIAVYEALRSTGQLSEDREYRNLFALYLDGEGREQKAIDVINEGLGKGIVKPDHQAYVALAQAYYFSDQPDKAIEAYQKAAPLASDGETHLNLAKVLAQSGRHEEARAAAQQALDKGVKNPDDARRLLSR